MASLRKHKLENLIGKVMARDKMAGGRFSKSRLLIFALFFIGVGVYVISHSFAASLTMNITQLATGFTDPTDIESTGIAGDNRLFIIEQPGTIKIVRTDGTKLATPFLNITSKVKSYGSAGEQGMLGLVFSPNYASNKFFYVTYTNSVGALVLSRYSRDAVNTDLADPNSEQIIITVAHPNNENHNAGDLHFGPDGFLYVTTGDGGGAGNTSNTAQNLTSLQGKMLRLDVNGGTPYAIPPTNPYAGSATNKQEIWASGLRNAWRFSFDRTTHDLWIGDVGQDTREEVDFQQVGATGGKNFGWRCYEGNAAYNTTGCAAKSTYVFPVGEYDHASNRCAVIGGYVYRGSQYPAMAGRYFFADYCSGQIYSLKPDGSGGWTQELLGPLNISPSAFGEDNNGELYITDLPNGTIYHLTTSTVLTDTTAPTVSVTSPSSGATVSGTANISANATDDVGVTKVEFYVDGSIKSTDTTSPYNFSWDTTSSANSSHSLVAKAYDAAGNIGTSTSVSVTVNNAVSNPLPSPWVDSDIGSTGVAGSASYLNGTFSIKGAGADIGGSVDGFHFVYQPLNGDGQITARIATMQNNNTAAKAGLMIRDNLNANSMNVSLLAQPTAGGGLVFENRTSDGANSTTNQAVPSIVSPYWLRLQRQGNTILMYWSSDGVNWSDISTTTLSLGINSYVGFAVSSHDITTLNTTTFDNVDFISGGNTPPLIDIVYPSHTGIYSGALTVTTNVSDADGISKVEFYIDNVLKSTDSSAPYAYGWDTTAYANGTHTLLAKAFDTLNNSSVHTHIVNIQNTGPKAGDINGDNSVNLTDLSFLLSSFGQNTTQCTTNTAFKCDLSSPGDDVVNIFDLSILLSNYGT
jgi:glucose/arabinose dehydrogenase/regulation of enolase protein 1 (concanavalin A-like superfamily)